MKKQNGVVEERHGSPGARRAVGGVGGHVGASHVVSNGRTRFIAGGVVIAGALTYMIYAGVSQSSVYFVTPTELQAAPVSDKAYRVGAMVAAGSLKWEPRTLELTFTLTDGKASIPVRHRGSPPDMFGEGRGAIVEGRWMPDGHFKATQILAKHSEEYRAPDKTHPVREGAGR